MWFTRKRRSGDDQIRVIREEFFDKIDQATKSIDSNTEKLDKVNRALDDYTDSARNIFFSTGGQDRIKDNGNAK